MTEKDRLYIDYEGCWKDLKIHALELKNKFADRLLDRMEWIENENTK